MQTSAAALLDYAHMSESELSRLVRMYRRNVRPPTCVAGHPGCGCTDGQNTDAPCLDAVTNALRSIVRRPAGVAK